MLKVIYFGTPEICIPSLEFLRDNPAIKLKAIVTMPDRVAGRGNKLKSPIVAEFAQENNIQLIQSSNINKEINRLKELGEIDIFMVFAFAQFLSSDVLALPLIGSFNIHTSLLPKYRGAAPIHYALLNDDKITGVSIQKMVKEMDAGDIATQMSVAIEESDNLESLYEKLKFLAVDALKDFIADVKNNNINFQKQNHENISFAPTIKKDEGFIDFTTITYDQLKNKIRALYPWPGVFTVLCGKRLKIFDIEPDRFTLEPGSVNRETGCLLVGLNDISVRLKRVQLEGKKPCDDIDLLNGLKGPLTIG